MIEDKQITFTISKDKIVELENNMVRVELGLTVKEFLEIFDVPTPKKAVRKKRDDV